MRNHAIDMLGHDLRRGLLHSGVGGVYISYQSSCVARRATCTKMPASKFIKLNTGAEMPTLGLGTWRSKPGVVEKAVELALKNGYRHIDTAAAYGNEKEVGLGIKDSGVPREEIFLTTKLANSAQRNPEAALEASLQALDTPYLDLWLMHWPAPMKDGKADKEHNWLDTWKAIEKIYEAHPEKVKAIGVSNISLPFMKQLLEVATIIPAVNQIELHPSCMQEELVKFCISKGISKIAQKYGVSTANVLISLQANRSQVSVIPKSVNESRIVANLKVIDLTDEEVKELSDIEKERPFRACTPYWTGWGGIGFPDCK
ncbi:putative reductase 1 [Grifola frondosa]|uniref:Putative reductase 1 n=1 Tax=Grifola frondosa TaxID=5627 RepID=A0A1C7LV92_GRIFR|nr:putative reductase 1 [Grifola frondosa]